MTAWCNQVLRARQRFQDNELFPQVKRKKKLSWDPVFVAVLYKCDRGGLCGYTGGSYLFVVDLSQFECEADEESAFTTCRKVLEASQIKRSSEHDSPADFVGRLLELVFELDIANGCRGLQTTCCKRPNQ